MTYSLRFFKTKKQLQGEVAFWSILLFSYALIQFFKDGNSQPFYSVLLENIKRIPAMVITAYIFNDVLLPFFYKTKKYIIFIVLTLILFYITSALDRIINIYVYEAIFRDPPFVKETIIEIFADVYFLFIGYFTPLLTATLMMTFSRMISYKNRIEKQNIELERDKKIIELNALKAQIHPHFLFNTLNNLYALTIQKSDKAPETVATLSAILDYMLYQCNDKLVSLDKEVELLDNYINLERLRYGDEVEIIFEKTYTKPLQIAPLILLSILENAFKHGASNTIGIPKVHISLSQDNDILCFIVKNTKNIEKQKDDTSYTKGIGVINIKQQLELLYSDFSYQVTNENDWYCVTLIINTGI